MWEVLHSPPSPIIPKRRPIHTPPPILHDSYVTPTRSSFPVQREGLTGFPFTEEKDLFISGIINIQHTHFDSQDPVYASPGSEVPPSPKFLLVKKEVFKRC